MSTTSTTTAIRTMGTTTATRTMGLADADGLARPESGALRAPGAGASTPAELTRRFCAAWAAGDAVAIAQLFDPGAVVTLAGGRAAVGREAIRHAFEAARRAGLDLSVEAVCEPIVTSAQVITSHRDAAGRLHTQIAVPVEGGGYRWVLDGTRLRDLAHP